MKRILVVLLSVLMLVSFVGCKKDAEKAAEGEKPAAEANAEKAADAAEAKKDAGDAAEAKKDAAEAADAKKDAGDGCTMKFDKDNAQFSDVVKVLTAFFGGMDSIAKDANGDCDKFGDAFSKHMDTCKDNFGAAMAFAAKLEKDGKLAEDSPEAKEIEKLGAVMEDSEFSKMMDKCAENNPKVAAAALAMVGALAAAEQTGAADDAAKADDAKAAE